MAATPIPVAIRLGDDLVLRGHEWDAHGPAVVFLHDVGADLDVWKSTPGRVAAEGDFASLDQDGSVLRELIAAE